MANQRIGLEDLDRLAIDTTTGQLFWDGRQVITEAVISLPTWLDIVVGLAAAVTVLKFALDFFERFGWVRPKPERPVNVTVHLGRSDLQT